MVDDLNMTHLSLVHASSMCEDEARGLLMLLRWPTTSGRPTCPKCGHDGAYTLKSRPSFSCKRCRCTFSVTSGTMLAGSKMSMKDLILAACIFVGGAKGISSLQLSRYLGRQYKSTFILAHKFREAMQRPDLGLSGVVQVDGCTIGGHRIAENTRDEFGKRRYRQRYENRRIVVVAREPFGNTKAFVGKKESDSLTAIVETVAPDSVIRADGSRGWNGLSRAYQMARIEHNDAYSRDGIHTNWAESYFAILRKMHYGTHHQISARHLEAYANELAWRQDHRGMREGDKAVLLLTLCLSKPPSQKWGGYWHRNPGRLNTKAAAGRATAHSVRHPIWPF
jgi:transposase-like protein